MLIRPREAPAQPPVNGSGLRGLTVYLAVIALTVAWVWTTLIPSALLRQAQDAHIAGAGLRPAFGRALTWPWPAYEAHEDLGLALLEGGAYERAYTHLRTAHQGIDTGEIYWLLAQNAAALGRPAEARRWLEACLWRWPRFEPAKTLRGELGAGGGS